jgi:hypothetical protein
MGTIRSTPNPWVGSRGRSSGFSGRDWHYTSRSRRRWAQRFCMFLIAYMLLAGQVSASEPQPEDACAVKFYRWMEDCRDLAQRRDHLEGFDRLRYLPLNEAGDVWLTLGGEYRLKTEEQSAPSFGLRKTPNYTAVGQRFLAQADLRTEDRTRVFLQLSDATDYGRRPSERSFDRSTIDLAQGFVDLPLPLLPFSSWMRIGRQELDLGGNRLVSTREVANLRRAFNMVRIEFKADDTDVAMFDGRPVANFPGSFDDRSVSGEEFWGINIHTTLAPRIGAVGLDLFYLGRRRPSAVFQDGVGRETRHTYGSRVSGAVDALDFDVQGSLQAGSFADNEAIRAWGIVGDVGYSWIKERWEPRFGVSFRVASGDKSPVDGTLGTFDAIYPILSYFTDAPLFYPGNLWDLQPNVSVTPAAGVRFKAGVDMIYRLSKQDAVYEPPGVPLIRGTGQGPAFVSAISYGKLSWRANEHVDVVISYVHAYAGSLIRSAGGRDSDYSLAQMDLHF